MGALGADPHKPASQTAELHILGLSRDEPDFLLNPRYRPALVNVDLLEQERARFAEERDKDFRSRFIPATRWFTGRPTAIDTIAGWLLDPATHPDPMVVTGAAGSGKTALLGLIAALTDPDRRPTVPMDSLPALAGGLAGTIDTAIYAGTQPTSEIRDRIASAADLKADSDQDLINQLHCACQKRCTGHATC